MCYKATYSPAMFCTNTWHMAIMLAAPMHTWSVTSARYVQYTLQCMYWWLWGQRDIENIGWCQDTSTGLALFKYVSLKIDIATFFATSNAKIWLYFEFNLFGNFLNIAKTSTEAVSVGKKILHANLIRNDSPVHWKHLQLCYLWIYHGRI